MLLSKKYIYQYVAIFVVLITISILFGCGQQNIGGNLESTPVAKTNPYIVSVSPATNESGVALNASIQVVFSQAMNPDTINSTTFKLVSAGNSVVSTITYDINTKTAILKPKQVLAYNTQYAISLTSLVKGINTLSINGYASTFNTEVFIDTNSPFISSSSPPNDGTGVDYKADIIVAFNEDINFSTVQFELYQLTEGVPANDPIIGTITALDSKTVKFTLAQESRLIFNTYYQARAKATDLAGNAMSSFQSFEFKAKGWNISNVVSKGSLPVITATESRVSLAYYAEVPLAGMTTINYLEKGVNDSNWSSLKVVETTSTDDEDYLYFDHKRYKYDNDFDAQLAIQRYQDDEGQLSWAHMEEEGMFTFEYNGFSPDSNAISGGSLAMDVINENVYLAIHKVIDNGGQYIEYSYRENGDSMSSLVSLNDPEGIFGKGVDIVKPYDSPMVYISYLNMAAQKLKLAFSNDNGQSWNYTTLDDQSVAMNANTAIECDSQYVFVAYYRLGDNGALELVRYTGVGQEIIEIDSGTFGQFVSMFIDQNNGIHIAYYDIDNNAIHYAYNADCAAQDLTQGWQKYQITRGTIKSRISITAHPNYQQETIPHQRPIIVYDDDDGSVKYVYME